MSSGPRKQSILIGLWAVWLTALPQHPVDAGAESPVSIELVLAVDISSSVTDVEYYLQMTGIAKAFRTPEIITLIQQQSGVAVTLFQWSSSINERYMIPWHLLHGPASVLSFAEKVEQAARDPVRDFTAIGRAIDFGVRLIAENNFDGRQLKIDISGDGRNNTGVLPVVSWRGAHAQGIVINGLPILIDTRRGYGETLDTYFRHKVIYGPGAFIEIATDYRDFAQAFLRKLRREIAPMTSQNILTPDVFSHQAHAGSVNAR